MVYNYLKVAQHGIYPTICQLCGAPGEFGIDICSPCLLDLPENRSCCRICAQPLPATHGTEHICGKCLQQSPIFDRCHAPFLYDYPISNLISDFKFSGKLHLGRLLAKLLIRFIETHNLELPDLIMPVPLHPTRMRERGFNQATELARPLIRHFDIRLDIQSCKRIKSTEAQSTLNKKIRAKNMRGAFEMVKKLDCEYLVLVDDVVTTGATVNELSKLLKAAGAKRVDVWALARTP